MKSGKQHIYNQPVNDITTLGEYAKQVQNEALQAWYCVAAANPVTDW